GIVPFAGFFSKDEILWNAFGTGLFGGAKVLWFVALVTAGLTAFYMTRLMWLTFYGEERFRRVHAGGEADEAFASAHDKGLQPHDAMLSSAGDRPHHQPGEHVGAHDASDRLDAHGIEHAHFEPHESPRSMTLPLIVLAVGSLVAGWVGIPHLSAFERWLEPVIARVEQAPAQAGAEHGSFTIEAVLMVLSLAVAGLGIFAGIQFYGKRPELPKQWAARLKPLYRLSFNKWYWDYLLDVKGVEAGKAVNNALWRVDARVVDGGVNGTGWVTRAGAAVSGWWDKWIVDGLVNATGWIARAGSVVFRTAQTGLWQNYALR